MGPMRDYKRIATEEAFATRGQIALFRKLLADGYDDPGFRSLWGFYLDSPSERARFIIERLQNLGPERIADMDASGIDMQVLSLTSPGVQVFDAATANALARDSNDELAAAIAKYPTRYVGLAAAAPQDPPAAAKEIERGVRQLGLRGVIMNSHTMGERLDNPKFWDIFAAAEALDVPDLSTSECPAARHDRALSRTRVSMARCSASRPKRACTCCGSSSPACSTASRSSR